MTNRFSVVRVTALALVIAAVDAAGLMAQAATAATVERFDLSGLSPRGAVEQSLRDRVARHRAGDVADAMALQRALASYYRTRGDTLRANAAAAAAVAPRSAGPPAGTPAGKPAGAMARYGDVPAPKYGDVPAPKYGDVPAPRYDNSAATAAPTTRGTTGRDPTPVREGASPASPALGPSPAGAQDMHFFHMTDPAHEDLWDFKADGSFSHTQVVGQGAFAARTSEIGTYTLANGTLVVTVKQHIGATSTTGSDRRNTLTADQSATTETRKYTVTLLGARGSNGMLLNGVRYFVKNW